MSAPINARAHGKVNLFLGVDSVRDDGYHNLVTVFQSISAHNDVTLTPVPGVSAARDSVVTELTVSGLDAAKVPTDASNLAWRGVDAIAAIARVGASEAALPCLRIHIAKSIPTAGGMAGGSADAAAALVAANEFYGTGLGLDDLLKVAATLGADVPFCVRGGTCLGTGRGDELVPVLSRGTYWWVFAVSPRAGLSTPKVFAQLDGMERTPHVDPEAVIQAIGRGDVHTLAGALHNDMEPASISLAPHLRRTLAVAQDAGALRAVVSGSGPTVAFLCADEAEAQDVADYLLSANVARAAVVASGPAQGGAYLISPEQSTLPQR